MQLQRKIGPIGLLSAAIGGVVGSGWLFGPMFAAQLAGPAAIISWILGGFLMLFIALSFAELSTTFPVAGGMVQFGDMSHGPIVSFSIGWMVWLSSVVVAPIETLAILQYATNYMPSLMHGTTLTSFGMMIAAVVMLLMCILNAMGAKFFSRTTTVIATIKMIVPIITIVVLFWLDFHVTNFTAAGGFMPFGWHGVVTALPLGGVIFSFIGYSTAIQLAGEADKPQRAIPFAIIGAVAGCIILYVLLQVSFIGAMNPSYLAHGWEHLSFADDHGPFAGILMAFGITWLVVVIYADAIVSPFGTAYIYTAATARVSYALCEIGFLPKLLQHLNRFGIPMRAMLMNYIIGLVLFLPFPGWQTMVSFLVSCFVVSYSIGPLALYCFREHKADHHRPFRLPAYRTLTLIAFYICNLLLFWTGWDTISRLLVAMLIGFAFFAYRYCTDKSAQWRGHWHNSWWLLAYMIALGVISYFGTFGGGRGLLSFGWDFVALAVLTIVIFIWAVRSAKRG